MARHKREELDVVSDKTKDSEYLLDDMAVLSALLNKHYQLKGYKGRDDYNKKKST